MEADTIALQETETTPNSPESMETSIWSNLVPMLLIFVVFYFLLIRPQEKKRKEQEALVLGIKKGEEVLTNAGLFGTVTKINDSDNTIILQIAKDTEIKILKNSIADITSRTDNKEKKKKSSSNKALNKKK